MPRKILPLTVLALVCSLSLFGVYLGCAPPSDPRCQPVSNTPDEDGGPDNSLCCTALRECCNQIPAGNGDPNQDPKLLCQKRADEGASVTCQAEYHVYLAQQKCAVPSR